MRYEIWQLPIRSIAKFQWYEFLKEPLTIKDYVMVYSGDYTPKNNDNVLEEIFELLNINHPKDYHVASLSVSDVICTIDTNNKREWWYVDGIGFEKLNWDV